MNNDKKLLFKHWDVNEGALEIIDSIIELTHKTKKLHFYPFLGMDPRDTDKILEKDDRNWVVLSKVYHEYN